MKDFTMNGNEFDFEKQNVISRRKAIALSLGTMGLMIGGNLFANEKKLDATTSASINKSLELKYKNQNSNG